MRSAVHQRSSVSVSSAARPSNCCMRQPSRGKPALHAQPPAAVEALVQEWIQRDPLHETRDQLLQLLKDGQRDTLQELLSQRLEFGTAGLRGKMGPGYNRMNHLVVQQTAQGLYRYLDAQCPALLREKGVAVGHDARHHSQQYARVTAAVFLSKGVPVHLFPQLVPTPFVAAAVAVLGCAAGVMVTASHNPKEYNGYKVYWGNGCQIIPPHDEGIAAAIEHELQPWDLGAPHAAAAGSSGGSAEAAREAAWKLAVAGAAVHPLVQDPTLPVSSEYYRRLATLAFRSPEANSKAQAVVYTPLHGVGGPFVQQAFQVMGLPPPILVPQQQSPDPEFPTVAFPNPEEGKGTWSLAFATGKQYNARLLLANDPDADRLAVAERSDVAPGGWQTFSGNEIGILLAAWMWRNTQARQPQVPPSSYAVLSSAVSSRMLKALAEAEGLVWEETLTGFKWLGNRALSLEQSGLKVLFAFEEAIGFMLGPMFKDKDGVAAAAVFAEMAAELYLSGSSVSEQLQELYKQYGCFVYRASYFIADRPEKSRAVFDRLCRGGRYLESIGGVAVESVRDLGAGLDTSAADGCVALPWRKGDMMLTFRLQGGACLTLRASGTEPKLKYYLEVSGPDPRASAALADRLEAAVAEEVVRVEESGLTRPQLE